MMALRPRRLARKVVEWLRQSDRTSLAPWYRASLEKRAATAGVTFEQRFAEETSNIPLRKYGEPDEVGVAVEGLLSAFSDHMTGLNILHDGGFTRSY